MFHYNNVVAAYHVFVCVVSRAGRQVDWLWFESESVEHVCWKEDFEAAKVLKYLIHEEKKNT
jgi:hypothetical protein